MTNKSEYKDEQKINILKEMPYKGKMQKKNTLTLTVTGGTFCNKKKSNEHKRAKNQTSERINETLTNLWTD